MITILAEKESVAGKIAAALDKITLDNGKIITFDTLSSNEGMVGKQLKKDGYTKIRFNGQDCYVTFGYGHLCELKQAKDYDPVYKNWRKIPLPFIPDQYEIQLRQMPADKDRFNFNKTLERQFKTISVLFSKSDYIINATDDDREGEVIFAYIYELAGCKKPVKRVRFNSQTKNGIQDAFAHLVDGSVMKNKEDAGRTRNIADWLVGSNLTAAMTVRNPNAGILSIGRVQTPTLKMITDRETAIRNFKAEPYWTVSAEFTAASGIYKGEHFTGSASQQERFASQTEAQNIINKCSGHHGHILSVSHKAVTRYIPSLYSLPAIQMEANARFGMTLKQTLDTVQWLYEHHFTTYPRTKSQFLTEDMEPTVNKVLDSLAVLPEYASLINGRKRQYNRPRFFNDKKVESHFAIIPTGELPQKPLSGYNGKIYDLICRSVIRMLYSDALTDKTVVITEVNGEKFVSSGSVVKDPQWMLVSGTDKETVLPVLNPDDDVTGQYALNDKMTEPPKRYTEKTILSAMITAGKDLADDDLRKILADPTVEGIGTPATRDAIIETLINREYIERNGKSLAATDKGIALIQAFPVSEVTSAEMTAKWEQRLADIENGKDNKEAFLQDISISLKKWCGEIETHAGSTAIASSADTSGGTQLMCPVCGKPLHQFKWGWGCTGYKNGCTFSLGTVAGKKLTASQVKTLTEGKTTSVIKGFRKKDGGTFSTKLVLDDMGKVKFVFDKK